MKLAVDPLALQPRVTDDSIPWLTRVVLPRSDAQTDSLPIWSHWRLMALVLSEPRTLHCWQTPRRCYLWCPKDFPWKSQPLHDLRCPLLSGPITPDIFVPGIQLSQLWRRKIFLRSLFAQKRCNVLSQIIARKLSNPAFSCDVTKLRITVLLNTHLKELPTFRE